MSVYNCADTLKEAIDSILNQTYTDWELIICNDASTDSTLKIAQDYEQKYSNIFVFSNEKNLKLALSLNRCLNFSSGEYIARHDGDDISEPNRLEEQVAFLDNNKEFAFVSSVMIYFNELGVSGKSKLVEYPTKLDFIKSTPFCHAPVMMRKAVLNEIGNYTYNKRLNRGQDYYLWYKFYKNGYKGANILKPLYRMRNDINAFKRRTLKSRLDFALVQCEVYKGLKLPLYSYFFMLINLLKGLLPNRIAYFFYNKI